EDDTATDIMPNEPYYTPQRPFGGDEDYIWSPDGKSIYYVCKKLKGTAYAKSTNTNIYKYDLDSRKTTNLTEDNQGYDTNPAFSNQGALAWLQMKTDGYEADKTDLVVLENGIKQNLTQQWDGTVGSFKW
ncbi:MAG: PD40 domain-containing protein, partial [Mangrovimonas sp.]|nr:PD40 domain-containing protein [Mangrovimonas sp.]